LVTKQEELAAKLGSIKHISSIASDANAKWIILGFILLLVLSLDPLAVALVVLCSHFVRKWFINEDTVVAPLKPKIPPKSENATVAKVPGFSKGVGDATKKTRAK
jgi:ABC-type iron transport system FetAB permease component